MNGQAQKLLELAGRGTRRFPLPTVVVASGKGGVGKTSLAVALGIALAERGRRVVLLDLDLGLANVSVLLGIEPRATVAELVAGDCSLEECLVAGPAGMLVLPASQGVASMADAGSFERTRLLTALTGLAARADVIVADAGAGASSSVLDFLVAADLGLLVTTPEPTAFTDAYAVVKLLARRDAAAARRLKLVLNRTLTTEESSRIGRGLRELVQRFLGLDLEPLADVPEDAAVARAARARGAFSLTEPGSPAARAVGRLARAVAAALGAEGAESAA